MHLLVVGCSKAKSTAPGLLPACERYDGTFWRVIRRAVREYPTLAHVLDIIVISAEFGAIESKQPIYWYERLMSQARVQEVRPQVVAMLNDRLMRQSYDDALICLGATYQLAIAGANLGYARRTTGGIGEQARQLKQWLVHAASGLIRQPHLGGASCSPLDMGPLRACLMAASPA